MAMTIITLDMPNWKVSTIQVIGKDRNSEANSFKSERTAILMTGGTNSLEVCWTVY